MNLRNTYPTTIAHYVFVLWGDTFDEDVATIFTTEARRMGLHVQMVGLIGLQAVGNYGITMVTDIPLGQALPLADNAICIVIPCGAATLQRVEDDPRLYEFLQRASTNDPLFVVRSPETVKSSALQTLTTTASEFSFYKDYQNLIESARKIATTLATRVATAK